MKNNQTHQKGFGLQPLPKDKRDFPLGGVYGTIDIKEVPMTDFVVCEPLCIKDQGDTDYCSAYAVTAVSEDQEGIEFLPEYQFMKTKLISGRPNDWGADLRSACKSAVKFGSLPLKGYASYKDFPREYIVNPQNWSALADQVAQYHRKETYFAVNGKHDTFDNIRAALWQHRNERSTVVTGALWRGEWSSAIMGIIPSLELAGGFGHAFKIYGQKVIDKELYLVAQLSNGETSGDKGRFYINRIIANRELGQFGIFMFKDISKEQAEYYLNKPYTINSSLVERIWLFIKNIFNKE